MTSQSQAPQSAAQRALDIWNDGRYGAAIDTLVDACADGDMSAMGFILTLSGMPEAPADTRDKVRKALESAPAGPVRNRHLAYAIAAGFGAPADPRKALDMRCQDARDGDTQASVELSLLAHWAGLDTLALAGLNAAAGKDEAHAIAALLRIAIANGDVLPNARTRTPALVKTGYPLSDFLAANTENLPVSSDVPSSEPTWGADIADQLADWLESPLPEPDVLNEAPRLAQQSGFLPAVVCDYLIANAAPHLRPAGIIDPTTGEARPDDYRKALTASLPDGAIDLVVWAIKDRMARLAGSQFDKGEALSILAYRPGDEYKAHFDFMTADGGVVARDLERRGQRVATSLVRLSDGFEGGATVFPRLDIRWDGKAGDAFVFNNVDETGAGDKQTLHAGEPVQSGLKLMASLWLRERA
tara:strand:+ start:425 stop:1669 length:1245 start_codon:yes stop_codon:yes gene_type:complete